MKKTVIFLMLLALPAMAATNIVWSDGFRFYTFGNTNTQTNVLSSTNFYFYVSSTNWAGTWGDYTGYYHGINSNGTIRTITNTWGW